MAKDLTTRIYHGKFRTFWVELVVRDKEDVRSKHKTETIRQAVVGTEKSLKSYIRTYLKPQYRGRGRKLEVSYGELETPEIRYISVPINTQAT